MKIKLKDFDATKHYFSGYRSNHNIWLQSPSLPEDIDYIKRRATTSDIEKLQKALKADPNAKAEFLIDSGSRGGVGMAWYKLKHIRVVVEIKKVDTDEDKQK